MPEYFSFKDAEMVFGGGDLKPFIALANNSRIVFIQGENLDDAGNAGRWIFGVDNETTGELIVYDRAGWTVIPWNRVIGGDEIHLDSVIPPETLFEKNRNLILSDATPNTAARRDIELRNGTYSVTITTGGTAEVLKFDAATGTAI